MPTLREYQVTGVNRLRNHSDCIHGHMCAADAASFAIVVLRHFVKVKKRQLFPFFVRLLFSNKYQREICNRSCIGCDDTRFPWLYNKTDRKIY